MPTTVYTIIGFLVGVGLVLVFLRPVKEKVIGICEVAFGRSGKKRENKNKILELLKEKSASAQGSGETKGEMSNSEIREALGVSRNTVGCAIYGRIGEGRQG